MRNALSSPCVLFINALVLAHALVVVLPRLAWRTLWGKPYPGLPETPVVAGTSGTRPYLLLLSFIEWDRAWQRPQHLASLLARTGEMDVACCAPVRAHNKPKGVLRLITHPAQETEPGLSVIRPLLLPGENKLRFFAMLNTCILLDALQRMIQHRGAVPAVLMTNAPCFSQIFSLLPAGVRVYDIMDDLVQFPGAPVNAKEQEREIVRQADTITTGTKSLERLKQKQFPNSHVTYVPCGVDIEHFAQAHHRDTQQPAYLKNLPRPIIGFFGALNERIDPEIIKALAREIPQASIVLVGPIYRQFPDMGQCPNVHLPGGVPYADLPQWLSGFDCAIVPYRLTNGIEFVQPVKVLEYLAGGKPVVSTAIPDVVALYPGTVRIARNTDEFIGQVRDAIAEKSARADAYQTVTQGHEWAGMVQRFQEIFAEAQATRQARKEGVIHILRGTHLGGAEEVVIRLCARKEDESFISHLALLGRGEIVERRLKDLHAPYWIEEMHSKTDLTVALRLLPEMRARHVCLTHTHTARTNLIGRLLTRLAGIPSVTTVQTAVARDINDLGRTNRVNAMIDKITQKWAARLLPVSRHNRDELLRSGETPERVVHIPNGVITRFTPPDENVLMSLRRQYGLVSPSGEPLPVVGMVASMRPRKGPETLIDAMMEIAIKMPEARLLMVGSGEFVEKVDYLETLRKRARDNGNENQIIFTGHSDDTQAMFSLMDVVVLPSRYGEGLPLTILEAMALGKPVVATRTEGNDEAVQHGHTGILVPPSAPETMADAILSLLKDPTMAQKMGKHGKARAQKEFCIDVMAQRYQIIYKSVINMHK